MKIQFAQGERISQSKGVRLVYITTPKAKK